MKRALIFVITLMLAATPTFAQEAEDALPALAPTTPMGANPLGNEAGTIPPWTGGLTPQTNPLPANVTALPDPFADEEPLFIISAENMAEHDRHLTPGHMALMAAYEDFTLSVYPSHRSCGYPQHVYDATKANAENASLKPNAVGVSGAIIGPPFPTPQVGEEVIWNHLLRYRGHKLTRQFTTITPTAGGRIVPIIIRDDIILDYADPSLFNPTQLGETRLRFIQNIVAPKALAGIVTLVHDTMDHGRNPRRAWQYIPEIERAVRAPVLAYDSSQSSADQLATVDQYDMFNGALDRYDWQLLGKQEIYVPYNSYKLAQPGIAYGEMLNTGHVRSDLKRYELHRVWVVEANLKPDEDHIYKKRVFYIDEDSWTIVHVDLYDKDDALWRVQEGYLMAYYNVPLCTTEAESVHDLQARRVYVSGLKNNEPPVDWQGSALNPDDFTPASVQAKARAKAGIPPDLR